MAEFGESLVRKFEAAHQEMERQDIFASIDTIRRWFPDSQERQAFRKWTQARADAVTGPRVTAEEFVTKADSTNFFSHEDREELLESINGVCPTVVPIGFDGNVLYRLITEPFSLQAHPREDAAPSSDLLLEPCFLGVNLTVQPPEPDGPSLGLSTISKRSAKGDDTDAPGFVFFQLGELQYGRRIDGRQGPWNNDDEVNFPLGWDRTGFVLVARVGESGRVDGIYAMYNMFTTDNGGYEEDLKLLVTHSYWGIPPTATLDGGDQFSCAKLGPRLSSFGKDHQIVWSEKIEHPVELVRVKHSKDGRVLRATVDEKIWPSTVRGDQTSG
ncbi:hypothetical protein B0I37DRAFT_343653 [Chaetomium sp. MPI-CAGE-AT-0009]|nr:hypothetical protein B0I37DRAFT_343653 [Chaetomium sp. MPI-CAGE-AT-0009]